VYSSLVGSSHPSPSAVLLLSSVFFISSYDNCLFINIFLGKRSSTLTLQID